MEIGRLAMGFIALGILFAAAAEHAKLRILYGLPDTRQRFGIFITLATFSLGGGILGLTGGVVGAVFSPPTLELITADQATQSGLRAAILFAYSGLVTYVITGAAIASLFEKMGTSFRRHIPKEPPGPPFQGPLKGA